MAIVVKPVIAQIVEVYIVSILLYLNLVFVCVNFLAVVTKGKLMIAVQTALIVNQRFASRVARIVMF